MKQKLSSILWKNGFRSLLFGFLILNIFVFSFFFTEANDMYHKLTAYTVKIKTLSQELIQEKQNQLADIANAIQPDISAIITNHNEIAKMIAFPTLNTTLIQDIKTNLSMDLNNKLEKLCLDYKLSSACVCDKFGTIIGQYGLDKYSYIDTDLVFSSQTLKNSDGKFGISTSGINYMVRLPTDFECFLIVFKPTQLHLFKEFSIFQGIYEKANTLKIYWYLIVILVFLGLIGIFLFYSSYVTKKVSATILNNLNKLLEAAAKINSNKLTKPTDLEITEFQNIADILIENQKNIQTIKHALKEKNAFISELDNISSGIILLSNEWKIVFINAQAATLLSQKDSDCINKSITQILPEITSSLESDSPQQIDKNPYRLLIKITKIEEKILLNIEDITYQISLQKQAAWKDVARVIAHEVKNPLTPTRLCAEQLLDNPNLSPDRQKKYLNTIINNVEHVNNLINDFTDFTKQVQQTMQISTFSLHELIDEICTINKLIYPNILFSIEATQDIELQADRKQILQALTNLIQNAAQACDTLTNNPTVKINYTKSGQMSIITIEDNGKGLATSSEKLFQPYMTTKSYGTGLGLVIVKKIAQAHLGNVTLESLPQGAKAIFSIETKTIA